MILGGSGQLGAMLEAFWPKATALTLHSTRPKPGFVAFDLILEPEKAAAAMAGTGAVICLSGVTNARAKQTGDGYSRNSDLALAAIRGAYAAGAGRVFLASSAAVYGGAAGLLIENAVCTPASQYGAAKLEMETVAIAEGAALGQPVTALRIVNVAGADAILGGWREGMQIDQLPAGATPRRSYIGPETLARVIHALSCQDDLPEVLNIAAPGTVEMGSLLDAADLGWAPHPAPAEVIAEVALDTKLLEKFVSFAPEHGMADGLVAEWRAFQAQRTRTRQ